MAGFCGSLGWGLDAGRSAGDSFCIVQLTPAGSGCSIQFGAGVTSAAPGSARDIYLTRSHIEAACDELVARGHRWPVPWPATAGRLLVADYPAVVCGGAVARDPCNGALLLVRTISDRRFRAACTRAGCAVCRTQNVQFGVLRLHHRPLCGAGLAREPRPAIDTLCDWRFKARAP
jgi:hypothetical protein